MFGGIDNIPQNIPYILIDHGESYEIFSGIL